MRVVIVDDEPLARERLRRLIGEFPGYEVVGEASDGEQALELIRQVDRKNLRLQYDLYHAQMTQGGLTEFLENNLDVIAHIQVAGVPGRNEIDETQELNYHRVSQVIADAGYAGYVAHEFVPRRDPMASLRQAAEICAV